MATPTGQLIGGNPIESHPNSYDRRKLSFELNWRIAKGYRLTAGIAREKWNRDLRPVDSSHENLRWLKFVASPISWFEFKGGYTWQDPRFEGEYNSEHEYSEFRMFDVADRNVRGWNAELSFYSSNGLDLDAWYNSFRYNYLHTSYGLQYNNGYDYGTGLTYSCTKWTIYANLSRGRHSNFMQSLAKSNLNGSVGFDTRNTWFSFLMDTVDVASLGVTMDIVPQRASLEFNYTYQQGRVLERILMFPVSWWTMPRLFPFRILLIVTIL